MDSEPVPGLSIRRLSALDWRTYRDVRLASLLDSPRAFWTTYPDAADWDEEQWRARLQWPTWLAYARLSPDPTRPPVPVGLVALWRDPEAPEGEAVLVQMWVATWARGRGAARALIDTAIAAERADGWSRLMLDVAVENTRAVALYRRMGFVETGRSARMPWDDRVVEIEMALDLSEVNSR